MSTVTVHMLGISAMQDNEVKQSTQNKNGKLYNSFNTIMSLQPNILLLFQALGMARLWPGSFQATQIAVDLQRMPICTSLEYSPTIRYNDRAGTDSPFALLSPFLG